MADLKKFLQEYYFLAARLDEVSGYPIFGEDIFNPKDPRNQSWHDANNKLLALIDKFKPDTSPQQIAMHKALKKLKKRITTLLASYKRGRNRHVH